MGPDVEGQGTHFSGRHRGLVAYGAAHQGGVECDCGSCAGLECARRGEGGRVGFDPRTPNTLDYSTMLGDILFNVFCTDPSTHDVRTLVLHQNRVGVHIQSLQN